MRHRGHVLWVLALFAVACAHEESASTWQVVFLPMIDVSPCQTGLFWSSQNIQVAEDGSFSEEWAPNEPGTARFEGTLYDDRMEATFQCVGNGTGTPVDAPLRGGAYDGTFAFGASSGCVLVFPMNSPTVTVQGAVHDAASGAALADATVSTSLDDRVATTNAHGQFYLSTTIEPDSDNASYTLSASAEGYQTYEFESNWGEHPTGLDIQLTSL